MAREGPDGSDEDAAVAKKGKVGGSFRACPSPLQARGEKRLRELNFRPQCPDPYSGGKVL